MIYVDGLTHYPKAAYAHHNAQAKRVGAQRNDQWCHMFADTGEELLAFAKRIGLQQKWLQVSSGGIPHFDLTPGRRVAALRAGARELTTKETVELFRRLREAIPTIISRIGPGKGRAG